MATARGTIEVDVPLSTAYNQWTQFESFPRFMSGVDKVTQTDDTHTHWVVSIGGVEREFDAQITDQAPDSHIEWASIGDLKQGGRVQFTPLGTDRTQIDLTVEWVPEGFVESAGEKLGVDERTVDSDLKSFKEFIEERGSEEGGWRGDVGGPGVPALG